MFCSPLLLGVLCRKLGDRVGDFPNYDLTPLVLPRLDRPVNPPPLPSPLLPPSPPPGSSIFFFLFLSDQVLLTRTRLTGRCRNFPGINQSLAAQPISPDISSSSHGSRGPTQMDFSDPRGTFGLMVEEDMSGGIINSLI